MSRRNRKKQAKKKKPHGVEAGAKGMGRGGFRPGAGRPIKPQPELPPDDETEPAELPSSLTESVQDKKLVGRAIRNRWPIKGAIRRAVVESAVKDLDHPDPKVRRASERNLIAADKVNVQREAAENNKQDAGTNINVNITMEAAQQQAELAAIAAEIRTGRVVDAREFHPTAERIDHSADGDSGEVGSQGSDGNG